jgi:hypothetical protein
MQRLRLQLNNQQGCSAMDKNKAFKTSKRTLRKATAKKVKKNWSFGSALSRSAEVIPGKPTLKPQPASKDFKNGAYRIHFKGIRDEDTKTSGITPKISASTERQWTKGQKASRDQLNTFLSKTGEIQNPFGKSHLAENSHLLAASLSGSDDPLNVAAASIHQNTEWLAIESSIKHLKKQINDDSLRIKLTAYVWEDGEFKGTLKAARYKIYIDSKKVFDHVSMGARGNIDKDETRQLEENVKQLSKRSSAIKPAFSDNNRPTKGLATSAAPIINKPPRNSTLDPQFTDLKANRTLKGNAAMEYSVRRLG